MTTTTEPQANGSTALATSDRLGADIARVMIEGDLSKLTPDQKVKYYLRTCQSLGLNPYTKPFDYLKLNGREVLYCRKDATDQLRSIRGVSIVSLERDYRDDLMVVTAHARLPDGRADSAVGAVPIQGLKGEALANALMKAESKAKRRVTLSICGLGLTDESEVDSIPGAQHVEATLPQPEVIETPAGQVDTSAGEVLEEARPMAGSPTREDLWKQNRQLVTECQRRGIAGGPTLNVRAGEDALILANQELRRRLDDYAQTHGDGPPPDDQPEPQLSAF